MNEELNGLVGLFHRESPSRCELREIRSEDADARWVAVLTFPERRTVLKIASNGFTTRERVAFWAELIAEYGKLGCYSPGLLPSLRGNLAEEAVFQGKRCVVWEEEYAKFHLRETLDKSVYTRPDGRYVYHDEVLAFLGRVGALHLTCPFPSGWVRFAPFGSDEETDEITQCVRDLDKAVRERAPAFLPRWERVRTLFEANARRLEALYPRLPTSVFQADTAGDNLILDESGHFKGVIDYNLAGSDTVLNMLLSMIRFAYSYQRVKPEAPSLLPDLNDVTQRSLDAIMLESLRHVRQFYAFSELEAEAAPLLLKYITCAEYTQLEALEKYAGDPVRLEQLFDFMEAQLLREGPDLRGAMLNAV